MWINLSKMFFTLSSSLFYFPPSFFKEGSQVSSSLAALQAERDVILRSSREKEAELSSLRQQTQQQQGSLDLERDRYNRELEALRAQLQQQVYTNDAAASPASH